MSYMVVINVELPSANQNSWPIPPTTVKVVAIFHHPTFFHDFWFQPEYRVMECWNFSCSLATYSIHQNKILKSVHMIIYHWPWNVQLLWDNNGHTYNILLVLMLWGIGLLQKPTWMYEKWRSFSQNHNHHDQQHQKIESNLLFIVQRNLWLRKKSVIPKVVSIRKGII